MGLFFSVQNYLIETRVEAMDATFVDAVVNMLPNTLVWADKVVGPIQDNAIEGMFWNIDQWGVKQ